MGMIFSQISQLLCLILLLSHVAWSLAACTEDVGRDADCPRSPPENLKRGPPSGRP
ncbi:hypothetical protein MKX03_000202 [Papaver bracteatum]|nr:hypothetical protein MKX03_000202 [Papaver bracteatum]